MYLQQSFNDMFTLLNNEFTCAGTTYSCVGAYEAVTGRVHVIPDRDGHFCIPSVVAFRYFCIKYNICMGLLINHSVC